MNIQLPNPSLVVLVGVSSSGKSSFARKHFLPTEVISSDYCRALVSDDENSLDATKDAFDTLHYIMEKRLKRGMLTVVDATNVQQGSRKRLSELARQYHYAMVAIVFNLPLEVLKERHDLRTDRDFGHHVLKNQQRELKQSLKWLRKEGFRYTHELFSQEMVDETTIERVPLWTNRSHETGPFDIIGDVHGCYDELLELLSNLGYSVTELEGELTTTTPEGRRAIFLGDLVDRGPNSVGVLKLAMHMVDAGQAICVPGNHDIKLLRWLRGADVKINHGLEQTVAEFESQPDTFRQKVARFIDGQVSHFVLDGGQLVVAHAGLKEEMQGRASGAVRDFCLFGDTGGEIDDFGLPVRYDWAVDYRGKAKVVYGHTPIPDPEWLNNTINIDTGCVFGGRLTALRYPEGEILSVRPPQTYAEPIRPIAAPAGRAAQQIADDVLTLEDVSGRRTMRTRYGSVLIKEELTLPALEVMSRFATDPKWLIHLPPTMSPCETSALPDYLEHPVEALAYFRDNGVTHVMAQEKHMGSRALVLVGRDSASLARRFGTQTDDQGVIVTRTGRRFFDDLATEQALVGRMAAACEKAGLWDELATDWILFDAELMPWSSKAIGLIKEQYAAVGASGLHATSALAELATKSGIAAVAGLQDQRQELVDYVAAYRRYCWTVNSVDDYRIAPFHLLASEGQVHISIRHTDGEVTGHGNHRWHMAQIGRMVQHDPILFRTQFHEIDLADEAAVSAFVDKWVRHTEAGGEGMVIKPIDYLVRGEKGTIQPAIKCRGRDYLRIIYGPEYLRPENLNRLKRRGLAGKRRLAHQELILGLESLHRFVERAPLRATHEPVFGVLALESEPVDARL